MTSCSLDFQGKKCVLEGIKRLQLKFECLPTDLRHEREPYGPRQIAPIRPGAWRLDRQRQVLQVAQQERQRGQAPPPQHTLFAVLREAFQPEPALDGLEEGFDAPPPLSHPRQIFTAQIEV